MKSPTPSLDEQRITWIRLHRRAVIGAKLLLGLFVFPYLSVLTWVNWHISFHGGNWSSLQVQDPGIPEFVALVMLVFGMLTTLSALLQCGLGIAGNLARAMFVRSRTGFRTGGQKAY